MAYVIWAFVLGGFVSDSEKHRPGDDFAFARTLGFSNIRYQAKVGVTEAYFLTR